MGKFIEGFMMGINFEAAAEFLTLGFVIGDETLETGKKVTRTLDVPEFKTSKSPTIKDIEESLKNSIEKAVKGKKNIAIQLSGGKDTRLNAALAYSMDIDFTAVTYGEKGSVDIKIAKKVANELGVKHKVYDVTPSIFTKEAIYDFVKKIDGLLSFDASIASYILDKKIAEEFDVILSGQMMSEMMDTMDIAKYPKDNIELMKTRWGYTPIVKPKYLQKLNNKLNERYKDKSLEEIIIDTTIKNQFLRIIEANRKNNVNLVPTVLDKEVLSNIYSLPLNKRGNLYLAKEIMRKETPKLLNLPYSYSGYMMPLWLPYITHQALRKIHVRGKRKYFGPYDVEKNVINPLIDLIENKIKALELEIIDKDLALNIWKQHQQGNLNTPAIGRMTTLQIWLEACAKIENQIF